MISASAALELVVKQARQAAQSGHVENDTEKSRVESVHLSDSFGRTLAEDIRADRDYPPFNRATMDGFALRSSEYSKDKLYRCSLEVLAGQSLALPADCQIVQIMTGAAVPEELDAIIKVEESRSENKGQEGRPFDVQFLRESVSPFLNIARKGEDLRQGEVTLFAGATIDGPSMGLMASLGYANVSVMRRPEIHIISTGDEIVSVEASPEFYQIRDSNAYTLLAFLKRRNLAAKSIVHCADDESALRDALRAGLQGDLLLLTGGVSMGSRDLVPSILSELGVGQIFHRIAIKPGKPLWFGAFGTSHTAGAGHGCAVFGLPGNPFSVQVCARIFVAAWLGAWLGKEPPSPMNITLAGERKKKGDLTEFFPVSLTPGATSSESSDHSFSQESSSPVRIMPLPFNGSGDITAGLGSDGIAMHPASVEELQSGNSVRFYPW